MVLFDCKWNPILKLYDQIFRLESMRLIILLALFSLTSYALAQKIDNTASFRELVSDRYFRVNYDNDYFAAQDKNYTQGYSFELLTPALSKNPINKILLHLRNDSRRAGIAFEHIGFTPSRYERVEIQNGDRPFAAVAILKFFTISTDKESKERIVSHFSFGIMGPAAKGQEIQTGIHKLTGDRVPLGWRNQIKNDVVVNYRVDYEKELLRRSDNFAVHANASVQLGSLFTNTTLGFNTTFGLLNNTYTSVNYKKFMFYGYVQPLVTAVGYDATLQGGIFVDDSVYLIPSSDVVRLVGQVNYGIVLQTKTLYLEYARAFISKEIKTLGKAAWGGIKIGFRI